MLNIPKNQSDAIAQLKFANSVFPTIVTECECASLQNSLHPKR